MKANCIIIHGCPSDAEKAMNPETRTYDKHWIPWTKEMLTMLGIPTETPLMPEPWEPSYEKFKEEFEKQEINENTILIGHSCGTTFLLRWLGQSKQKVTKLILVGPWAIADKDNDARRVFYEHPIDPSIKERVGEIIYFTSDNEYPDGQKSLKIIHDVIGGEIIDLPGRGHYIMRDMGTIEFPELVEQVVSFDNRKALIVPINSQGKILIQDRRGHKKPDWGYFGGEIEGDEIPVEAVIRETREELTIDISESELTSIGTSITVWGDRKIIRYMYLYPTDQEAFDVREGKAGLWLTFEETRGRMEDPDRFDEVAEKIVVEQSKS
ncbi:NUDIX domain-containing protein [Patescibacteria group bacterium]|nr:NUDIX domain-containing protein [Patescibacteria group bacterium]